MKLSICGRTTVFDIRSHFDFAQCDIMFMHMNVSVVSTRMYQKNDISVILNEILLSVQLDEGKNQVRVGEIQADSSTCQKRKAQNDDGTMFLK